MGNDFGVGLAAKGRAVGDQTLAQFAEVFDDAVVHDRDAVGGMGMSIALSRPAMRRPAGVANTDIAAERLLHQPVGQRLQFAFGAAARHHAVIERGDARGVIAAIFEAPQRIDQMPGNRAIPKNSDDPAHPLGWPLLLTCCFSGRR